MARKALIVDTDVREVKVADPFPDMHEGLTWIDCSASVKSGWSYFNSAFVAPPPSDMRKPQWNGSAWETGETQQEIDARDKTNAARGRARVIHGNGMAGGLPKLYSIVDDMLEIMNRDGKLNDE